MDDEAVIGELARGNAAALEQLFERHGDPVYSYLLRCGADPGLAEDLTQDTFIRALEGAHLFEGRGSARGWLYKIAGRLLLDAWRRQGRKPPAARRAEAVSTAELAENMETHAAVRWQVDALPEPLREALLLRVVDGLSYQEIYEATGAPERTGSHRLGRAVALLRAGLEALNACQEVSACRPS